MRKTLTILTLLCSLSMWAEDLHLAMPFTDHCVLQRYQPIHIEGTAAAGSIVKITLSNNSASANNPKDKNGATQQSHTNTTAASDGHWQATLPPMAEGTGFTLTVTSGGTTICCNDVAIGEVWVASGQSNMAFRLNQAIGGKEDIARAVDPMLRFLDMKPRYETTSGPWSEEALTLVDRYDYYRPTTWQASTPQSATAMSAIGYYFGRQLRDSLQVPIGIINNSIGGAPTEAWTDMGTLRAYAPEVLADWQHNELIQDWVRGRATENIAGDDRHQHPYKPAYLFDTGITPLAHYAIAGVVWYQGESNAHNTVMHERLFELLVQSWRQYWQRPLLPFAFVQLSSIARPTWPEFRDSQRRLQQRIPMTGMAVSSDVGDSLDVHPRLKRSVGERLARWALHQVYSRADITPSGPMPKQCTMHNAQCIMHNEQSAMHDAQCIITMENGRGMKTSDGQPLRTFEMAGADGIFHPATATIAGESIIVTCPQVTSPRFVRYAWQPFTRANLVGNDGLPASTFCLMINNTDNNGYSQGVSAAFAGTTNGCALVAGGCNFPENPLARDSKKVFYDHIYKIEDGAMHLVGHLPHPVAYGVSATTPDGIFMAGGTGTAADGTTTFNSRDCWLVTMHDGQAVVKPLPPLPCSIDNAAACAINNKVYIAGGNCETLTTQGRERNGNTLLCFDGKEWSQLPPIPGNPRTQPVMASAPNAKGEMCLWLFGGFNAAGTASTLDTDGLVYIPSKKKWQSVPGPVDENGNPLSVAGGCAATLPDGRIVVTGGVNRDIFLAALKNQAPDYLSHPASWYRFNDAVLVFTPATKQWQILRRDSEGARAGAVLIPNPDGTLLLYGGELKPRIRTPKIYLLQL